MAVHTTILFNRWVPMRDGVMLSVDIYGPADIRQGKRYPVILTRTPYLKADPAMLANARYFAEHEYVFVAMDVRGRGDSDGVFVPYRNEGRDGYDSIEWCAVQDWSDGNVGTLGGSYLGRVQWLAAVEQPPHLRAMIPLVTPSDPFVETPTGVESPMHLCWVHLVSGRVTQVMEAVNWTEVYQHLPLATMDEQAGLESKFWRTNMEHPLLDDYWRVISYQDKFAQIQVPVLHISGWYDDEQIGTPLNFTGMTTQGATPEIRKNQRLLMGPWGHRVNTTSVLGEVDFGPQSLIDLHDEELRWFNRWLKHEDSTNTDTPVRIFVMGENQWRDEQEWPLSRTQWTPYYLHSGGRANSRFGDGTLSIQKPNTNEPQDSYNYDPVRPVPFITEPTSSQIGGPDDYAAIERRDDVLVYLTEPLDEDIEVTGPIRVTLYAASSAVDTDFMVKLVDAWPTGFVQRVCDSMVRTRFRDGMDKPSLIEPEQIYKYTIDCWYTSQVFKQGHRVGLEVSSSAFPKYDRNLNTGAPLGKTSEMVVAHQWIYHDESYPSMLMLPIIATKQ